MRSFDKFLFFTCRGQRRLLKALSEIEQGTGMSSTAAAWMASETNDSDRSVDDVKVNRLKAIPTNAANQQTASKSTIEVRLTILSNWGHADRVGLTEIQFYDLSRKKIEVRPADVKVHGAVNVRSEIDVLFNGKFKVICNL